MATNKHGVIRRDLYIDRLCEFIDKPFIKVITGIRRSGKSMILSLLKEELQKRGVEKDYILYLNFESFNYSDIRTADKFYAYIKSQITDKRRYYILLDEIQEVSQWEKAVDAIMVDFPADLYITGSNSRLLSSELATYLAGRYVEIHVQTLSFAEYILFKKSHSENNIPEIYQAFDYYLRSGGFPVIHTTEYELETAHKIIYDIYSSAILRDTVQRYHIRDIELLERVIKFIFDNVGSKFSARNVSDFFKSQYRKIDLNTVYNYLNALEGAFIVYRVPRYDVKGKEILKTLEKFYLGDHALLYAVMGYKDRLISGVLENIVMLELKRKGYQVFVGKSDQKEIDFVAEKKGRKVYIQVAFKITEQSTVDREFNPLVEIRDHYPKYVVTMDETWKDNIEGIQHRHIADFLLMTEY